MPLLPVTSGLQVHDTAGVGLGELHHVLLYELPHAVAAAVIFTKLERDPRQLRDEPAHAILQRRIRRDPARLHEHAATGHPDTLVSFGV